MSNKVEFLPAIPIPMVFDVKERIIQLRGFLERNNQHYQPEPQHPNIKAAITLYEEGKLDGFKRVMIMGGKIVSEKEAKEAKTWCWTEGMRRQMAQKHSYGHGPFGPEHHEIRLLLRLTPEYGGDGTVQGLIVMNDIGSDVLTLFSTDLPFLGNIQMYTGWRGVIAISNANGTIDLCPEVIVEVQLVRDDNSPWSGWIEETAIVRQAGPGLMRLSGNGIRSSLYFGSAPGNHSLAVSATKGGLSSLL